MTRHITGKTVTPESVTVWSPDGTHKVKVPFPTDPSRIVSNPNSPHPLTTVTIRNKVMSEAVAYAAPDLLAFAEWVARPARLLTNDEVRLKYDDDASALILRARAVIAKVTGGES